MSSVSDLQLPKPNQLLHHTRLLGGRLFQLIWLCKDTSQFKSNERKTSAVSKVWSVTHAKHNLDNYIYYNWGGNVAIVSTLCTMLRGKCALTGVGGSWGGGGEEKGDLQGSVLTVQIHICSFLKLHKSWAHKQEWSNTLYQM